MSVSFACTPEAALEPNCTVGHFSERVLTSQAAGPDFDRISACNPGSTDLAPVARRSLQEVIVIVTETRLRAKTAPVYFRRGTVMSPPKRLSTGCGAKCAAFGSEVPYAYIGSTLLCGCGQQIQQRYKVGGANPTVCTHTHHTAMARTSQ